jgi:16S rRNA (guanine966-N2)-methyltransferase
MRERAFAVLGERVAGARFLDLYAGTGAVGLEALSRGARSLVLVEKDRTAARLIEKNLSSFDLADDRAELVVCPASAAADRLARREDIFDIAWVDPPFEDWKEGLEVVVKLFGVSLLHEKALVCLECPEKADVAGLLPPDLQVTRDLVGGASRVIIIVRDPGGSLDDH